MEIKSKFATGPWFVYIILCENNSLYTGITKDLKHRFHMHSLGKGAKYTRIYKPVQYVHVEEYEEHSIAFKRELQIKSYPKSKKQSLNNLISKNEIHKI